MISLEYSTAPSWKFTIAIDTVEPYTQVEIEQWKYLMQQITTLVEDYEDTIGLGRVLHESDGFNLAAELRAG